MRIIFSGLFIIFSLFVVSGAPRPVIFDPSYEHDKWITTPVDHSFHYAAYTGSFDTDDDNNGDAVGDIWGIPEWVAFEIKAVDEEHNLGSRPGWMTDNELYQAGIAPNDDSYKVSGVNSMKEVKTDYRFVRGHMCPKDTAERISANAAYNTHILLNAVPQLQWQNNGIWKDLEGYCTEWAEIYGRVWVICGPVFFNKTPGMWLGQDDELRVAIPDALFKIVIREDPEYTVKTLAYLIPNVLPKEIDDPGEYLTSINRIERLTGLNFLTVLDDENEETVEEMIGKTNLW